MTTLGVGPLVALTAALTVFGAGPEDASSTPPPPFVPPKPTPYPDPKPDPGQAGVTGLPVPVFPPPPPPLRFYRACLVPTPVRNAFDKVPNPKQVPQVGDASSTAADKAGPETTPSPAPLSPDVEVAFTEAAFFPLPRYDLVGQPVSGDGALIYEGMTLRVGPMDRPDTSGHFTVRFNVTVPEMPVTLRLQLYVQDSCGQTIRLTLPPIKVPYAAQTAADPTGKTYQPATFQVTHEGYSPDLARMNGHILGAARVGAARFGSLPDR